MYNYNKFLLSELHLKIEVAVREVNPFEVKRRLITDLFLYKR